MTPIFPSRSVNVERRNIDIEATVSTTAGLEARNENVLSVPENFRRLEGVGLPCLEPLGEVFDQLVSASNYARYRGIESRYMRHLPFDVLIQDVERGGEVATVEGVEHCPHNCDVLLRHRLLRQPHGFEGIGTPGMDIDADDLARTQGVDEGMPPTADLGAAPSAHSTGGGQDDH